MREVTIVLTYEQLRYVLRWHERPVVAVPMILAAAEAAGLKAAGSNLPATDTTARQPSPPETNVAQANGKPSPTAKQAAGPPERFSLGEPADGCLFPAIKSFVKNRKSPTGPHAELVRYFCGRWRGLYQARYPFTGQDAGHLSKVLKYFEGKVPDARKAVDRYFACDDNFIRRARHPAGLLLKELRRFVSTVVDGKPDQLAGPPVFSFGDLQASAGLDHRPTVEEYRTMVGRDPRPQEIDG